MLSEGPVGSGGGRGAELPDWEDRGPLRRCAGCRRRRPKAELLRFVRQPDGVAFDPAQVRQGRGGYCCPEAACVDRAFRRGGLGRTLRMTLPAGDAAGLAQEAVEYLKQRDFT